MILENFHEPTITNPARKSGKGGGLATYINKRLCDSYQINKVEIENTETCTIDGEFSFIKINFTDFNKKSRAITIGNVYRSPSGNLNRFLNNFESVIKKISRHDKKLIIITGDFNINLLGYDTDAKAQELHNIATEKGYVQVISKPTRITDHSCTLIDHIYTNQVHNVVSTQIFTIDISDHLATCITTDFGNAIERLKLPKVNSKKQKTIFKFNDTNTVKFTDSIAQENWASTYNAQNANEMFAEFHNTYNKHYNAAYTIPSISNKRPHERRNVKPWMQPWLEDACHRKNALYKNFIISSTKYHKDRYTKMKKFVNTQIQKTKRQYYATYFN